MPLLVGDYEYYNQYDLSYDPNLAQYGNHDNVDSSYSSWRRPRNNGFPSPPTNNRDVEMVIKLENM